MSTPCVETDGVYYGLPDVEPWDEARDARVYSGPHSVVAHPPCKRWGKYWSGGPNIKVKLKKGDDGGCFASALAIVRRWGGVIEHPEGSHAWYAHGLNKPPKHGGWVTADFHGGWTCCVEQGHYGHRARKATWLYVVGCELPTLIWGKAEGKDRMEGGFHSTEERRVARAKGVPPVPRLTASERLATPIPFRDLLLTMARGCNGSVVGR